MSFRVSEAEGQSLERAAKRGLWVCAAVLGAPLVLAVVFFFIVVRDYAALHLAAAAGDLTRAEEILRAHPERIDRRNKGRQTPLHVAASESQADMIALLLRHGADPNARLDTIATGDGHWTALHLAATRGHVKSIEALLAGGADINAVTLAGETPLDVARRNKQANAAELLSRRGGKSLKDGR
jgi:ankyrin repeat protein